MVALGECCRVVNGTTPAAGDASYWNGDIVWVTPTDLGKLDGIYVCGSARTISRNALDSHNLTLCPPGSVVLSSRAPIGHLGIAAVPLCTNQGCKTLVPCDGVHSDYLYYALLRAVPDLKALGSGATFAEVSKAQIENFEIPLPPLAEQERIAARLSARLSAAEEVIARCREELAAIEALPAALLRQAFGGGRDAEAQEGA
jgi:type I restriction enzyme S subunit